MAKPTHQVLYYYTDTSTLDISADIVSIGINPIENGITFCNITVRNPDGKYSGMDGTGNNLKYGHGICVLLGYDGTNVERFQGTLEAKEPSEQTLKLVCAGYEITTSERRSSVPCFRLIYGSITDKYTIRQILLGKTGTADTYGWKPDALLKNLKCDDGGVKKNVYVGTIADDSKTNTTLGMIQFSHEGGYIAALNELADKINYRWRIRKDFTNNNIYFDFLPKKQYATTWTISRGGTFGPTTRGFIKHNIRRSRIEQVELVRVYGANNTYGVAGEDIIGATKVLTKRDEKIWTDAEAQIVAESLLDEYGIERYEGAIEVQGGNFKNDDKILLTDSQYQYSNLALRIQQIRESYSANGYRTTIGVDKNPWQFSTAFEKIRRDLVTAKSFKDMESYNDCPVNFAESIALAETIYGNKVPGDMTGTPGVGQVALNWTIASIQPSTALTADSFTNYTVRYRTMSGGYRWEDYTASWGPTQDANLNVITTSTTTVTGLTGGTTYYFRIFIHTTEGGRTSGNEISAVPT